MRGDNEYEYAYFVVLYCGICDRGVVRFVNLLSFPRVAIYIYIYI